MGKQQPVSYDEKHFSRLPFYTAVQLYFHANHIELAAKLLDISLKGALIETTHPLVNAFTGKFCRMDIVAGKGDEHILMSGKVVHHEDYLMVVECQHIDLNSVINLRRLVELNKGDDALLDRALSELLKTYAAVTNRAFIHVL